MGKKKRNANPNRTVRSGIKLPAGNLYSMIND